METKKVHSPLNGIWEFNMVGDVPPITDDLVTQVSAQLEWGAPKDAKGVKVFGEANSKSALLHDSGATPTASAATTKATR